MTTAPYPTVWGNPEEMLVACCVERQETLDGLRSGLFGDELSRHLFEFLVALKAKSGRLQAYQVLFELQKLHPEHFQTLCGWVNTLPSPEGWSYWETLCRERAAVRHAAMVADQLKAPDADLPAMARQLLKIEQARSRVQSVAAGTVIDETMDAMDNYWKSDEPFAGIATKFHKVDQLTDGLTKKALWVIAASPGVGKTTLSCSLAVNLLRQQVSTAYFTLEMPRHHISQKMMHCMSRVSHRDYKRKILSESDVVKLFAAGSELRQLPIHFYDDATTLQSIGQKIRELASQSGLRVAIVDYLQRVRIEGSDNSRWDDIATISNTLKNIALETDTTVVALSQIRREVKQEKRRPQMTDLKGSSEIEADADVIAFIHEEASGRRILIVEKARLGEVGDVPLVADLDTCFFGEEAQTIDPRDVPK